MSSSKDIPDDVDVAEAVRTRGGAMRCTRLHASSAD